jgi:hypothetical protein
LRLIRRIHYEDFLLDDYSAVPGKVIRTPLAFDVPLTEQLINIFKTTLCLDERFKARYSIAKG